MSELREALDTLVDNGLDEVTFGEVVENLISGDCLNDSDDEKYLALVAEFGTEVIDASEATYDDCLFESGGGDFLVLNESEKEERWDESLDQYLDDGLVEGADSAYFDREQWKHDARMDGAGHALASYDGNEYERNCFGEWYYIYRVN